MGDTSMSDREEVYPVESRTSMSDNRDLAMNDHDEVYPVESGTSMSERDLETRQRNDRSTTSNDADVIIIDNRDETR